MADHLDRARVLRELGRYDAAEREVRNALADEPDNAAAHCLLADVLLCLGRPHDALDAIGVAISRAPNYAHPHYLASYAYDSMSEPFRAAQAIGEALRLDSTNADYFSRLACLRAADLDWTTAISVADEGLRVSPQHAGCLAIRARALQRLGHTAEAERVAKVALAIAPEEAESHRNLGNVYLESHRPELAYDHYNEALRLAPTDRAVDDVLFAVARQQPILRTLWRFVPEWYLWRPKFVWCYFACASVIYLVLLHHAGLIPFTRQVKGPDIWEKGTILWRQGDPSSASMAASIWAAIALSILYLPLGMEVAGWGVASLRPRGFQLSQAKWREFVLLFLAQIPVLCVLIWLSLMPFWFLILMLMGLLNGIFRMADENVSRWPFWLKSYGLLIIGTFTMAVIASVNRSSSWFCTFAILFFAESFFLDDVVRKAKAQILNLQK